MVTFSNPRLAADFDDWPLGGNKRGPCSFYLEHSEKRGWRFIRVTFGKPKTATFGGRGAIVDGSNGRTYLIQQSRHNSTISIFRSDFMTPPESEIGQASYVIETDPQYRTLLDLIVRANYSSLKAAGYHVPTLEGKHV